MKDNNNAVQSLIDDLNGLSLAMFEARAFEKGSSRHNVYNIPVSHTDINRLLFRTPLIQPLEMNYPTSIDPEILADVYRQQGALMISDVETYTSKKRMKAKKPLPIGSLRTTNRIGGGSALERTPLSSILDFDVETGQDGMVIGMYWEACRFYDIFRYSRERRYGDSPFFSTLPKSSGGSDPSSDDLLNRIAVVYLVIYRWRQHMNMKHIEA